MSRALPCLLKSQLKVTFTLVKQGTLHQITRCVFYFDLVFQGLLFDFGIPLPDLVYIVHALFSVLVTQSLTFCLLLRR